MAGMRLRPTAIRHVLQGGDKRILRFSWMAGVGAGQRGDSIAYHICVVPHVRKSRKTFVALGLTTRTVYPWLMNLLAFVVLAQLSVPARQAQPVLGFPEPGLDDTTSYQGYQTRFYRDAA